MKKVLIIGSGISGLTCAIRCARNGVFAMLVSPYTSERAQSVMAAGGINAVLSGNDAGDRVDFHIEDTLKGGRYMAGKQAVSGLCEHGEEILRYLEGIGTVFSIDENGHPMKRAFGGQSYNRTYYCGSGTGKLIVSALVMEARRYGAEGLIRMRTRCHFHSALLAEGVCYGALIFDESTGNLEEYYADAVVIATGGQNALFGKTTGSTLCDGYAAGQLFLQGAELKNLEFVQYHPTTIETAQKRMLISEAVRGEGGRLYYLENGKRIYFLEDKYGPKGNLMTRDVISREMEATGREIYLDISFLDKKIIESRLSEVQELCSKYRSIDITREPIPVAPSVHFFMGGLAVHHNHETSIHNLFAIGECASIYHGANRLGGNSLLAAIYSGNVAADEIAGRSFSGGHPDFATFLEDERKKLKQKLEYESPFPVMYIRDMLAKTMRNHLGIVRDEASLDQGISEIDYILSIAEKIRYDNSVFPYYNYSLKGVLTIARAALVCAKARKESRGAHYRSDYPKEDDRQCYATIISYDDGNYEVRLDKEFLYES